jgi:tRNA/tmRNA/rRNA uracil-C5-methylase (TrmA/RlmC/RlmD family)
VLASPQIRGYRNKIEYSFGKFISGRKEEKEILSDRSLGFHRQGMFGKIVDIDQCYLVDKDVNELFNYIKNKLKEAEIPVYDQMMHDGILRHLMIRQAKRNNQIMVILSAHSRISAYQAVLE